MYKKKSKFLALVASGSGGHIIPALTLGKKWKKENPNGSIIFFVNTVKQLDLKIIEQSDQIDQKFFIELINSPGKNLFLYPKFISQFFISFIKSLFVFYKHRPEEVISTGSHTAIPVCLAASILKVPINLYELNFIPGKTIKGLTPLAKNIFLVFPKSTKFFGHYKNKCMSTKYPIKFTESDLKFDKEKIIEKINSLIPFDALTTFACSRRTAPRPISYDFAEASPHMLSSRPIRLTAIASEATTGSKGLDRNKNFSINKKTLFILGGSQGSIFINNLIKKWLKKNKGLLNIQIIHQTGNSDPTDWQEFYSKQNISVYHFEYSNNIKEFYQIADLVISRTGAGTLFELEFFKRKAIIIPLETNNSSHQLQNALEMSIKNPALFITIRQKEITDSIEIQNYLDEPCVKS